MSTYLDLNSPITSQIKRRRSLSLSPVKILISMMVVVLSIFSTLSVSLFPQQNSHAWDPITETVCLFADGGKDGETNLAITFLELKDTNKYQWMIYSKSSANVGLSNVDDGLLNGMLNFSRKGETFGEVNEKIIGRPLDRFTVSEESKGDFNAGKRVNPYERFGLAGLNFTAYFGEWKYAAVDVCSDNPEPVDTKSGQFYDDRLAPKSTWDETSKSEDPRSQAVVKNGFMRWMVYSAINLASNVIFWIAKFAVAVALTLISISLTDFSSLIGLDKIVAGTDQNPGVVSVLFEGLFIPLSVMAVTILGVIIIWQGLAKRAYRKAFTMALQMLVVFLVSFIFVGNVTTIITLPNRAAVVMQAIVAESLNSGSAGGKGVCKSEPKAFVKDGASSETSESSVDLLNGVADNMVASVGCQFWNVLLFEPWSKAQWGESWKNLYANPDGSTDDKSYSIPEKTDEEAEDNYLNNDNYDWVGSPAVPMGNGEFEYNWALFNISVQTNAHSPIGHDGSVSQVTNGISNDWWRIVDATSNYKEVPFTSTDQGSIYEDTKVDQKVMVPDPEIKPTEEWYQWSGTQGNPFARLGHVIMAVFVALISVIVPIFFSFFVVLYSIGMEVLLIFLPVVLLFALVGDWGMRVAKEYGKFALQLFLKRVMMGVLMILSISFTSTAINMMDGTAGGYLQGLFMMVAITIALIVSRKKIIGLLTNFSFTQSSMAGTSDRISGIAKDYSGRAAKGSMGATVGGLKGATSTTTVRGRISNAMVGAKAGFGAGIQNKSKTSRFMKSFSQARYAAEGFNPNDNIGGRCASCRRAIEQDSVAWRSANGLIYCDECGNQDRNRDGGLRQVSTATAYKAKKKKRTYDYKPGVVTNDAAKIANDVEEYSRSVISSGNQVSSDDQESMRMDLNNKVNNSVEKIKKNSDNGYIDGSIDNLGILNDYIDSEELERVILSGEKVKLEAIILAAVDRFIEDFEKDPVEMMKKVEAASKQRKEIEILREADRNRKEEEDRSRR